MAGALLRRVPFTAGGVAVIVVLGVVLGTFATPIGDQSWGPSLSYGVPAFAHGHLWTALTGAPFAVVPLFYVPVLLSFAAFVGCAEYRFGTARTVLAWLVGQLVGVGGATAVAAVAGGTVASTMDVGPSAGSMAVAALLTASFPARWRLAARLGLFGYLGVSLAIDHSFADLAHLVAVLAALPFGSVLARRPVASEQAGGRDRALALLAEHGGGSLSWMTTWPGVHYFVRPDGFLAYRRHAGVAVVLGEPVGTRAWRARAAGEFADHCATRGLVPCWFSVGEAAATALRGAGWRRVQIAEDALVDLPGLRFRGKAWQDVRTARNRAEKEGIEFRMLRLADAEPAIARQVRAVSTGWLRGKRMPELGFTLGGVSQAMDPRVRVGIAVDRAGRVHGVTSWLPIMGADGHPRGWTLDMMRRRADGFRPVVEFLIASACLRFQEEGADVVSLSGAPLARTEDRPAGVLDRLLDVLGRVMEPWYGFRSLHAFKAKFQPRYEPLYLMYRHGTQLPRIGAAVLRAYLAKTPAPRPVAPAIPIQSRGRAVAVTLEAGRAA
jgi:lysylphosphatidylglycerol synthetase-like protein (DUF2156 family)